MKNITFYPIIGLFALLVLTAWKQDELVSREIGEIKIEATRATAYSSYVSHDDIMGVHLQFEAVRYDNDSTVLPPTILQLYTYMPYDVYGIAEGRYEVNDTDESMTVFPGSSFVLYYESEDTAFDISSGSMTVSAGSEDDHYSIVCDFLTEEGTPVKCTYEGEIIVYGMPVYGEPIDWEDEEDSTITFNLEGASAIALSHGDYYDNKGKNWKIFFKRDYGCGDGLRIDINAKRRKTSKGIPSGTYKAATASSGYPAVGEYCVDTDDSTLWCGVLLGTCYYSCNGGDLIMYPFVEGDIIFVNNGDGTYKFEFTCTDDDGDVWKGEWEGTIIIDDTYENMPDKAPLTGKEKRSKKVK